MFTTAEQTKQQTDTYVAALEREKAGYLARNQNDRAAAVDAELARLRPAKKKR